MLMPIPPEPMSVVRMPAVARLVQSCGNSSDLTGGHEHAASLQFVIRCQCADWPPHKPRITKRTKDRHGKPVIRNIDL